MGGILDVLKQQKTRMKHKKEKKDPSFPGAADIIKTEKPYKPRDTLRGRTP